MPLHLIGLGLSSEKDITVRGLEIVRSATRVYLEAYTAVLLVDVTALETFYERPVVVADREMVESASDDILAGAQDPSTHIAFLVVGDPLGATTHTDMIVRAREAGIAVNVVHNASILNAIGCTGLQLYNFGQTISMVFFTENWKPTSWYDRVLENRRIGLHTLVLVDIKVKEPDLQAMIRGKKGVYEPPRYMTVAQCAEQMIESEAIRQESAYGKGSLVVGVARVGSDTQEIRVGTLEEMANQDLGPPLHSLVLVGSRAHDMEKEVLRGWAIDQKTFDDAWERECGDKK